VLIREDGNRKVDFYTINSNYLQNVEGAVDSVHFSYLHMDNWSKVKHRLATMPKPELEFREADFGIWQKSLLPDINREIMDICYAHFFMPAGFVRIQGSPRDKSWIQKFQSWYVPIDDTHTIRFQVAFSPPHPKDGRLFEYAPEAHYEQPGPLNDYYRRYDEANTISGIPNRTSASGVKGFLVQDSMVNESQGLIADRSREHLGVHDKVLTAQRIMCLVAVENVRQGRDPKHIIRDLDKNQIVHVHGDDPPELV